jgi:TPR repeat protein
MLKERVGVRLDRRSGIRWLRKAAEGGDTVAMVCLGVDLMAGQAEQGVAGIKKAGALIGEGGMLLLGEALADGRGVGRDAVAAVTWCIKSAELGCQDAICRLGMRLARGKGWLATGWLPSIG